LKEFIVAKLTPPTKTELTTPSKVPQALSGLLLALSPLESFSNQVVAFHPDWRDQTCLEFPALTYQQWRELFQALEQAKASVK
jgi:5-methylcytosine-specific restriction endonuclease McrBC GTP-binding regulatory subunit McrB